MENGFWSILLVAGAASAATTCWPRLRPKPLSYEEAVELSIDLYNENAGENVTFLLYKAAPHPEWDGNSANAQELEFTLKEAVCLASASKPPKLEEGEEECSFKNHGLFKKCFGYIFLNEEPPAAVLACRDATEEEESKRPKRVKRFKKLKKRFKKGFRKIRKRLGKHLKKTAHRVIKDKIIMVAGKLITSQALGATGRR